MLTVGGMLAGLIGNNLRCKRCARAAHRKGGVASRSTAQGARRLAPLRGTSITNGWRNKCRRNDRAHRSNKRQARRRLHTTCRPQRPQAERRAPMSLRPNTRLTKRAQSAACAYRFECYSHRVQLGAFTYVARLLLLEKTLLSTKFIYRLISR